MFGARSGGIGGVGWVRVLEGVRMVARAAADQTQGSVHHHIIRVTVHAADLASQAAKAATKTPTVSTNHNTPTGPTSSVSPAVSPPPLPPPVPPPLSTSSVTSLEEVSLVHPTETLDSAEEDAGMKTKDLNTPGLRHDSFTKKSFNHPTDSIPHATHLWEGQIVEVSPNSGTASLTDHAESTSVDSTHLKIPTQEDHAQPPKEQIESSNQQLARDEEDGGSILDTRLREGRPVPSTRVARAMGFASLGAGMLVGTAVEGLSRLLGREGQHGSSASSLVLTDGNADRLAASLCRMRGAALKMGQMLSIQDESLMPPTLTRALQQVRQGADAMPKYQLMQQLESQLGKDWRRHFEHFDEYPMAAASIGQVHRATLRHATERGISEVAVKVQYPGVARSIESDLRNLAMLVQWTGLAPKGLFLDNVIRVGQDELRVECDYLREMDHQRIIRELVRRDTILMENRFIVPEVVEPLTTDQIITTEFRPGGTIDKVSRLDQEERNRIGRTIMYMTIKELFDWRFMQTDPNWGNFLYDMGTRTTSLIDFGSARRYSKEFVDGYLRIVWASANQDEQTLMEQSHRMKFLTGEENEAMLRAHALAGFTVGEPFRGDRPFDFRGSNISVRMGEHTSVFLRHRLTPPPDEIYTLHRKLAGAYMLCIKLGAVVSCRELLVDVLSRHTFEDGADHPLAST